MPKSSDGPGFRTQVLLLVSLALMIAATAATSLLIVRNRVRAQVRASLNSDLEHSVGTFQDLEDRRREALLRENALLADLPSLKALMTTSDSQTIADGAVTFWKTSGNDLFALTDSHLEVVVTYAKSVVDGERLRLALQQAIQDSDRHYLVHEGHLYEFSLQPLRFGGPRGTVLGYVVGGYAIDRQFLEEVGRGAGAQASFVIGDKVIASTLPMATKNAPIGEAGDGATIVWNGERYVITRRDLSRDAGTELKLVLMKSLKPAEQAERELIQLVFFATVASIAVGALLMMFLARLVTRPLEQLAVGVRAFGAGDGSHPLPGGGTEEVRYLSRVFAQMRGQIEESNRALLEQERLATIGRMASSVSHDLRHYLASVYANAEFLASPALSAKERMELYEEIRLAVQGTTEMLDSLLIFSRSGKTVQRIPVSFESLAERAIALVKVHPDAMDVAIRLEPTRLNTVVTVDPKQIERALYNLLLNACQAAREASERREVVVRMIEDHTIVGATITDSGAGVPEDIRDILFDPFISRGKQKGTGLGLTLAWSVAREHGGEVELVQSVHGETVFRLTVRRGAGEGHDEHLVSSKTEVP